MLKDRDRETPLLEAIYTRLATIPMQQGTARGFTCSCYDQAMQAWADKPVPYLQAVEKDQAFPYLVMGGVDPKRWGTKTKPGTEMVVNFMAFSQYTGYAEMANIAQVVLDALTSSPLDLSAAGLNLVLAQPLGAGGQGGTGTMEDGRTRMRRIPFRFVVEDTDDQDPKAGG